MISNGLASLTNSSHFFQNHDRCFRSWNVGIWKGCGGQREGALFPFLAQAALTGGPVRVGH